jgi:hypothetical protein
MMPFAPWYGLFPQQGTNNRAEESHLCCERDGENPRFLGKEARAADLNAIDLCGENMMTQSGRVLPLETASDDLFAAICDVFSHETISSSSPSPLRPLSIVLSSLILLRAYASKGGQQELPHPGFDKISNNCEETESAIVTKEKEKVGGANPDMDGFYFASNTCVGSPCPCPQPHRLKWNMCALDGVRPSKNIKRTFSPALAPWLPLTHRIVPIVVAEWQDF